MSKTMKRVLSMVFALVLILSMVPTGAFHHHAHAAAGDTVSFDFGTPEGAETNVYPNSVLTSQDSIYQYVEGTTEALTYVSESTTGQYATLLAFSGRTSNANNRLEASAIAVRGKAQGKYAVRLEGFPAGKELKYNMNLDLSSNSNQKVYFYLYPGATTAVNAMAVSEDKLVATAGDGTTAAKSAAATVQIGATDVYDPDGDGTGSLILVFTTDAAADNWKGYVNGVTFTELAVGCEHLNKTPATCTTGETCTDCGEVLSEPASHNFVAANDNAVAVCTVCGAYEGGAVAKIGDVPYATLQKAINAVEDGQEITMIGGHTVNTPAEVEGFDNTAGYGLVILGNKSFTIRLAGKSLTLNTPMGIYVGNPNAEEGAEKPTVGFHYGAPVAGETCAVAIYAENVNIAFNTFDLTVKAENGKGVWLKDSEISFTSSNSGDCSIVNTAGGYNIWAEGASQVVNAAATTFAVTGEGENIHLEEGATAKITGGVYSHDPSEIVSAGYIVTVNEDGTYSVAKCAEHVAGETVIENQVDATCTAPGSYDEVVRCTECGAVLSKNTVETAPAIDHAWNEGEITVAPGCTTEGEKTVTCTACGETKTEVVAAAHAYERANEYATGICSVCGAQEKTSYYKIGDVLYPSLQNAINAVQDGETITITATHAIKTPAEIDGVENAEGYAAIIDGHKAFTISLNGKKLTINTPKGIYINNSSTEEGAEQKTVVLLGGYITGANELVVAESDEGATVKSKVEFKRINATATAENANAVVLNSADLVLTPQKSGPTAITNEAGGNNILATGNARVTTVGRAASTNETAIDGYYYNTLKVTGEGANILLEDDATAAITYGFFSHEVPKAQMAPGYICTYNEEQAMYQGTECPEHVAGETVIENVVDATCTAPATYDEVVRCTECGAVLSKNVVETAPANDHAWDEGVITVAPGCTTEGEKLFTCTACGETKTEVVAAAHTYERANEYATGICAVCGELEQTSYYKIGDILYPSLQNAVNAVQDGETIMITASHAINTPAEIDGVENAEGYAAIITGHKGFTISLNGKKLTINTPKGIYINNSSTEEGAEQKTVVFYGATYTGNENCTELVVVESDEGAVAKSKLELQRQSIVVNAENGVGVTLNNADLLFTTQKSGGSSVTNNAGGINVLATGNSYIHCQVRTASTSSSAIDGYAYNKLVVVGDGENIHLEEGATAAVAYGFFSHEIPKAQMAPGFICTYNEEQAMYQGTECPEHVAGETVIENQVDATCDAPASYDEVVRCTECAAVLSKNTVETAPAIGHAWDEGVITVAPGCTTEGEKLLTCGTCGETKTEAVEPAHTYAYANEYAIGVCSVCGESEMTGYYRIGEVYYASLQNAINAVQDGETITITATRAISTPAIVDGVENAEGYAAIIDGHKDFTISLSGKTLTLNTPKGIYINNSSTEEGAEQKTVVLLGGYIIGANELVVAESDEGATVKSKVEFKRINATATAENANAVILNSADLVLTPQKSGPTAITNEAGGNNILATGNARVTTVGRAASTNETAIDGYYYNTLKVTGEGANILLEDDATAAITYGFFSHEVPKAQMAPGYICTYNEELALYEGTECPEHVAGETVIENVVDATCDTPASYDEVVRCTECGAVVSKNTVETAPAIGHAWDEGVITITPDCTTEGEKLFTCGTCGETKTEAVAATHTYAYANEYATGICSACGAQEKTSYYKIGDILYPSLQNAVNAVQDGETIMITASHAINTPAEIDGVENAEGYAAIITGHKGFTISLSGKTLTINTPKGIYINNSSTEEGAEQKKVVFYGATYTGNENCTELVVVESDEGAVAKSKLELQRQSIVVNAENGVGITLNNADLLFTTQKSGGSSITNKAGGINVLATGNSYIHCLVRTASTSSSAIDGYAYNKLVVVGDGENFHLEEGATAAVGFGFFSHEVPKAQLVTGSVCVYNEEQALYQVTECTEHTAGETVIENQVDATCTAPGSYDEVTYCTECGAEVSRNVVANVPALGHTYEYANEFATGICSVCGTKEQTSYYKIVKDDVTVFYPSLQNAINAVQDGETITITNSHAISTPAMIDGVENAEGYAAIIDGHKAFTIALSGKTVTLNTPKGIYINNSSTEEGAEQKTVVLYGGKLTGANELVVAESDEGATAKSYVELKRMQMIATAENANAVILNSADLLLTPQKSGSTSITNQAGGNNILATGNAHVDCPFASETTNASAIDGFFYVMLNVTGEGANILLEDDATAAIGNAYLTFEVPAAWVVTGSLSGFDDVQNMYFVKTCVHSYTDYVYNNDATTEADGTESAICDNGCGMTDTRTAEGTMVTKIAAYIGDVPYASVQAALDAAKEDETVSLSDNAAENSLNVYKGVALDLNGYILTVNEQVTAYGEIKGDGQLVAPENKVLLYGQTTALPVWNDTAYTFEDAPKMSRAMMQSGQFAFQPQFSDDVEALFVNGQAAAAGLKIMVTLTYELSGNTFSMDYEVPADKAQTIISKNQVFGLLIQEDFSNLTYTAKVVSNTGAAFTAKTVKNDGTKVDAAGTDVGSGDDVAIGEVIGEAIATVGDVSYNTVQEAIDNANGQTVTLNANASAISLDVYEGVTLDLNGFTMTVAKQVSAYGEIKGGSLVAPENRVILKSQTSTLPVWNDNAYTFATAPKMNRAMMQSGQFAFQPQFSDDVEALFANGQAEAAGLKIVVTLTYVLSGNTFSMEYEVPADKAQTIISKNQVFGLIIQEAFSDLTYTAKVVSDTGAVFASKTVNG